jgi:hypothetical protein
LVVGGSLGFFALVSGCGARGPLDVIIVEETPADASMDAKVLDGSTDGDGVADAFPDALESGPEAGDGGSDGNPLFSCGQCLLESCGNQVITCITASACTTALQCAVTTCLASGTPDLSCIGNCANGDSMTETQLLSVIGCVVGTCGTDCVGLLGGLGGLGGGGGGGGGG